MPLKSLSASEAWKRLKSNQYSWHPSKSEGYARLSPIAAPMPSVPLALLPPPATVFTIGSCFARNIEEHLQQQGYEVPCLAYAVPKEEWKYRPSGILNKYTPHSMLNELRWAFNESEWLKESLIKTDQGYLDMQLPRTAAPVTHERAIQRRQEIIRLFSGVTKADHVLITFGLVESWFDKQYELHLNSTVPRDVAFAFPDRFEMQVMSFEECYEAMSKAIALIRARAKNLKSIIVTVSPVPLRATFTGDDVLVANCYSKSVLRSACEQLAAEHGVLYFPSYESVMLSRGDSIWQDDMVHVRSEVVEFNVSRLGSSESTGKSKPRVGHVIKQIFKRVLARVLPHRK